MHDEASTSSPWEISLYNPISPCCQHIFPDIQFTINIIVFLNSVVTNAVFTFFIRFWIFNPLISLFSYASPKYTHLFFSYSLLVYLPFFCHLLFFAWLCISLIWGNEGFSFPTWHLSSAGKEVVELGRELRCFKVSIKFRLLSILLLLSRNVSGLEVGCQFRVSQPFQLCVCACTCQIFCCEKPGLDDRMR